MARADTRRRPAGGVAGYGQRVRCPAGVFQRGRSEARPRRTEGNDAGGCAGPSETRRQLAYENEPFRRTRPVAEGFAATATATPANVLLVEVVVMSFAESSQ